MRPSSLARGPALVVLRPSRRRARPGTLALSSSSAEQGGGTGGKGKEEEEDKETTLESAHFNVVAAEARSDPKRRFNVSTSGERRQKVQVFRDLTRNRESFRERTMEHDTFVTNLPRALQQYEEEQQQLRYQRNPLVRDQQTLVINKHDASNRRWLSGSQDAGSASLSEREALAQRERLSGVQGAVVRKRAGLGLAGLGADMGVPEEGLSVEEKIQLAMAQGAFDDLKGKGKPLERYSDGQYFEDRASHLFMDALHKSGVKPVWVDRSARIKQMHALLRRRVQAEWARLLLEHAGEAAVPSSLSKAEVAELRRRLRERAESLRALEQDLAFVNSEIDLFNLQVPSMNLQRVRLRLDYLLADDDDGDDDNGNSGSSPDFLLPDSDGRDGWRLDAAAARACLRQAERDGLMSSVTSLGNLRLEVEEDRARQRAKGPAHRESGEGGESLLGGRRGGRSGSGAGGILDSLTSWFTGSKN